MTISSSAPESSSPTELSLPPEDHGEVRSVEDIRRTSRKQLWRWVALGLLLAGLLITGKVLGLEQYLNAQKIRQAVLDAGSWGVLLYLGVFALGELMHVPGLVFVAAGVYAYGRVTGGALAIVGAIVSVSVSFFVVRLVGGKALAEIRWSLMRKILDRLDERPIRVVAVLRLIFWLAPPVNYALALSAIRFRDFLIGSALGLAPVLALAVLFFDWIFG